ncbi:tetratricopeptide repeat protein [bacterium]|nr:tetratricopeptide repeat protein [bacterium]
MTTAARPCLALLLFFSLISHPATAAVSDDMQFAAALYNDGRYQEALEEFRRIRGGVSGGEWEDDVLFWMSECLFYLKDYDGALELHRTLMTDHSLFPKLDEVYVKAIAAHYNAGRHDRVMELADLHARKFPGAEPNDQVYLFRIQSGLKLKEFRQVEDLLKTYQRARPGSPYLMSLKSILARSYLDARRLAEALPYFEELYQYQKDVNLLLWVGECRYQTGALAGAKEAFSGFLAEQPGNDVARFKLGLCEFQLNQYALAAETFRPLSEKAGGFQQDALYFVAQSLLHLGRADAAKQSLENLLKLSPKKELSQRAVSQLISLESKGKDIDQMIRTYEKYSAEPGKQEEIRQFRIFSAYQKRDFTSVLQLIGSPGDRREQLMLAESLYALGKYADAARSYGELLAAATQNSEKRTAYAGLAWTAYAQEDYRRAFPYFQSYLSLSPASEVTAEDHLALAQSALASGKASEAIAAYEHARKSSEDPKAIARNLGILYFNSANYKQAVDVLQGFEDDQVLSIVGRSYLYLKQPARALTYLRKLKHPERYALEIGAIHYEMGQFEEAKTYFEQAAASPGAPGGVNVDEFLGIIAYNQGNFVEAAARLRKAQLKDPNNPEVRFELAASLMRIEGAPERELVDILTQLASSPGTPESYRSKARMWLAQRMASTDLNKAMDEVQRMTSASDRTTTLEAMATRFFSEQRYDTAVSLYQQLLASPGLSPESRLQALYGLGWSYYKMDQKPKARETFNRLIAAYPKSSYAADAVVLLVEDAYASKRYEEAADLAVRHLGSISKNQDRLRFLAAEALYELKKYDQALTHYGAYLPKADQLADYVRYRSGLSAYHLRRYQQSISNFSLIRDTTLLERKHYYLGMSYTHAGRKAEAVKAFETVLDFPNGEFRDEAWNNLVLLMEALGQWQKALRYEFRLAESESELERLVFAKALYYTNDARAARYAEKLGYIARDPAIASEALLIAGLAYGKPDPAKSKMLLEKVIIKFPKSASAPEAKKALDKLQ